MNRLGLSLVVLMSATLLTIGCSQANAPAATKTSEPIKATEPTRPPAASAATVAPVAQPTATPLTRSDYPQKGKSITIVVGWAAGGNNDIGARIIAPLLEKELGTPVQVVNKAGAGGQIGFTDVAQAKPDGYTLSLMVLPPAINIYMNPEVKPQFNRDSFTPVAVYAVEPVMVGVKADSPYKSAKDMVEYAKANPEKLKFASTGVSATTHMQVLALQRASGAKFARVQFDGDSPAVTALLGGHVDAVSVSPSGMLAQYKSGAVRAIGYSDRDELSWFPDAKGFPTQGYDVQLLVSKGIAVPKGTPADVVDVLKSAMAKVASSDEFKKRAQEAGVITRYMDQSAYVKHWDQMDELVKPLLPDLLATAN